jgi:uncharacterized membrane protein YhaH (DUF805 family)
MEWYIKCWQDALNFTGRAGRKEFWLFVLINWLVTLTLQCLFRNVPVLGILIGLYQIASVLPCIAVGIRRMHDTNKCGWWLLINLIPIIGNLLYLVLCALPGTMGANQYGNEPNE